MTRENDTGEEKFWIPIGLLTRACGHFEPEEWLTDKCPKCSSKDLEVDVFSDPLASWTKDKIYVWYGETACNNCKWEGDYMKVIDVQGGFPPLITSRDTIPTA